ncbi:hypothetical protein HY993_00015 [Candidatus Micrarchaeota archaeon]|nr:hypothetical protein [Candidatus Micrarchaeota archaeon]
MNKPIVYGTAAGASFFAFYMAVLTVLNSFEHALSTFVQYSYFMIPLIIGFGIQVGLFFYVKSRAKAKSAQGVKGAAAATGGISSAAMIACCAHHATDVLPFLGLAAASAFLAQFQELFLAVGVFSNVVGIMFMLKTIKEHELYGEKNVFSRELFKLDLKKALQASVAAGSLALAIIFFNALNR